uniref:DUF4817 domain-containing protein n=1 Tax=Globodera rostochiensis TaxID=31243 RepID=A0A914H1D9_GLORO
MTAAASKVSRVLSMLERAKLVCWFEETNSYTQTARRYRNEFGMEPPKREQVIKWHDNFLKTGAIGKMKDEGKSASEKQIFHKKCPRRPQFHRQKKRRFDFEDGTLSRLSLPQNHSIALDCAACSDLSPSPARHSVGISPSGAVGPEDLSLLHFLLGCRKSGQCNGQNQNKQKAKVSFHWKICN